MATQPLYDKPVSVEEYLSTVYEHDCEYVDGVIEERDLGEFEHAYIQGLLITLFNNHRGDWRVYALPEQRVQTQKTHFRVPDVTILREGAKRESILTIRRCWSLRSNHRMFRCVALRSKLRSISPSASSTSG